MIELVRDDADFLDEIAGLVNRLNPGRTRSHEEYFVLKDEVVVALRRKARALRSAEPALTTVWRAPRR